MNGRTNERTDGWTNGRTDGWTNGRRDGQGDCNIAPSLRVRVYQSSFGKHQKLNTPKLNIYILTENRQNIPIYGIRRVRIVYFAVLASIISTIIYFNLYNIFCHTAIEILSDPIGYLLDFTNPYYTALASNMKARAKKDNSF